MNFELLGERHTSTGISETTFNDSKAEGFNRIIDCTGEIDKRRNDETGENFVLAVRWEYQIIKQGTNKYLLAQTTRYNITNETSPPNVDDINAIIDNSHQNLCDLFKDRQPYVNVTFSPNQLSPAKKIEIRDHLLSNCLRLLSQ